MRWRDQEGSRNVEDRRGRSGGGGGSFRTIGGGAGIVMFLAVAVAGMYGIDLTPLLGDSGGGMVMGPSSMSAGGGSPRAASPQEEEMARFSSVVLRTTEDVWGQIFRQQGLTYRPPKMVLYTEATPTGCGYGEAAMGPFYCPEDQTVYLDVAFYNDLKSKMGGGGDFAQGYVVAHEVGHHVQHLLGTDEEIRRLQDRSSEKVSNQLSVCPELQADCYAGVWGREVQKRDMLDPGDVEQALRTAQAIGDDRLQRMSTGRVVPDSFTHGTSEQRLYWFKRGFDTGDPGQCNTCSEQ